MAKNIALRIKVEFIETEVKPTSDRCPQEQADSAFSLVLPEADELNISALDRTVLDVSLPALREALSRHLRGPAKKLQSQVQRLRAGLKQRWASAAIRAGVSAQQRPVQQPSSFLHRWV